MRKLSVPFLCLLLSLATFPVLPAPAARASGWEWRQVDWSGGPGQASWKDDARYESSYRVDTFSVPGTIRLSHRCAPFTRDPSNPVLTPGGAGAWDRSMVLGFPRAREGGGYEILYRGADTSGTDAVGYASSPDGVAWTKHADNPVLSGGTGGGTRAA